MRRDAGADEPAEELGQVISLDPNFSAAYGLTLECLVKQTVSGWKTIEEAAAEGKQYALRALEVGADDAYALARAAFFFGNALKDGGTANVIAEQAIAVNPNSSEAWRTRGWMSTYVGQHEPAIEQFNYAMRLNPLDPQIYQVECGLAWANFFLRRFEIGLSWAFDEAVAVTKKALRQNASYSATHRGLVSALAHLGRDAEAREAAARLLEVDPAFTITAYIARGGQSNSPLLIEGLRKAGLPE